MRPIVLKAIQIIKSHGRVEFKAECKTGRVQGRDGRRPRLAMVIHDGAHALADQAGQTVTVVIDNLDEMLSVGDSARGDPDQLIPCWTTKSNHSPGQPGRVAQEIVMEATRHPKEYGLLFIAAMARAAVAGIKTQTRHLPTASNSLVDGVVIEFAGCSRDPPNYSAPHTPLFSRLSIRAPIDPGSSGRS